jgi:enolase
MKIKSIKAFEILDSRGNPTVKTLVELEDGAMGITAVPSGASTGAYEAKELRDEDKSRYNGLGVLKAVENVNSEIAGKIIGMEAGDQEKLDQVLIELDGTEEKARLGANAILSVSVATARAQASSEGKEVFEYLTRFNSEFRGEYLMPIPEMNILNGAKHAGWTTDIQEYMIFPINFKNIKDAIRANVEVYHALKKIISEKGFSTNVGDEGGFAPSVSSNAEPFDLITEAVKGAGYRIGEDIYLGVDVASSEFFENSKYKLRKEDKEINSDELKDFYKNLIDKYPIISIEDPFSEDDWEAYKKFTSEFGEKIQIVGDDLFVTNVKRLKRGIEEISANSILIKLNQIGTLTETIQAVNLARESGMTVIISHRSGETEDSFIADFAVAMGTGQIKSGAPARSDRVAKYNRLLIIEEILGEKASYSEFPFKVNS